MPRVMFWISKLARVSLASLPLFFVSCASDDLHENLLYPDVTMVVQGTFDEVWAAVAKPLDTYPIRTHNMDSGILETEPIPANKAWMPPHIRGKRYPSGQSYMLKVQVIRGRTSENAKAFKVVISKRLKRKRDFFSSDEELISDGLEEKALAYRIRRELTIDRALKKALHRGAAEENEETLE